MTTLSTLRRIPTRVGAIAIADEGSGTPVVLWPSLFSDHRLYAALVPFAPPEDLDADDFFEPPLGSDFNLAFADFEAEDFLEPLPFFSTF